MSTLSPQAPPISSPEPASSEPISPALEQPGPGVNVQAEARPEPHGPFAALRRVFPAAEVVRYLIVGGWNTAFALGLYWVFVDVFTRLLPHTRAWIVADLASVVSTPIGITMAFFCYKHFVFRTKGNYLREWLRCFAVYSVSFPVGLVILAVATPVLAGWPLTHTYAPKLAGLVNSAIIATYSYFAHKKFSFKR